MVERVPLLVVDDELIVTELMGEIFATTEFDVTICHSAEETLATFRPGRWHGAILDKNLPGMTGIELMKHLKQADEDLAIIIMTGYGSLETALAVMRMGAFDYILKPFDSLPLIVEKLRRAVERRKSEVGRRLLVNNLVVANDALTQRNTEISLARDEIARQARMASMGQLASGIAHELNNPLTFVKSNVYIIHEYVEFFQRVVECATTLKAALDEGPERRDAVARELVTLPFFDELPFFSEDTRNAFREVKDGIERAIGIVRRMKEFTYYERGSADRVDLRTCVERAVTIVVGNSRPGVTVSTDYVDEPMTHGVANQLTQVFINLLSNALTAVEGNVGTRDIRILQRRTDRKITTDVTDNGRGIPPENLDRIFEPFFSTDELGHGIGLGLNIVKEVLHHHGGTIRVQSTVGRGSTFSVELPEHENLA